MERSKAIALLNRLRELFPSWPNSKIVDEFWITRLESLGDVSAAGKAISRVRERERFREPKYADFRDAYNSVANVSDCNKKEYVIWSFCTKSGDNCIIGDYEKITVKTNESEIDNYMKNILDWHHQKFGGEWVAEVNNEWTYGMKRSKELCKIGKNKDS